jgi:hypothetical protein
MQAFDGKMKLSGAAVFLRVYFGILAHCAKQSLGYCKISQQPPSLYIGVILFLVHKYCLNDQIGPHGN